MAPPYTCLAVSSLQLHRAILIRRAMSTTPRTECYDTVAIDWHTLTLFPPIPHLLILIQTSPTRRFLLTHTNYLLWTSCVLALPSHQLRSVAIHWRGITVGYWTHYLRTLYSHTIDLFTSHLYTLYHSLSCSQL